MENALGLLAIIAVTIYLLVRYGRWPHEPSVYATSAAASVGVLVALAIPTLEMGIGGEPYRQAIIPAGCYFLLTVFLRDPNNLPRARQVQRAYRASCWFIIPLSLFLSLDFIALRDSKRYTGDPGAIAGALKATQAAKLRAACGLLEADTSLQQTTFPPGWLDERLKQNFRGNERYLHGESAEFHSHWHTWLTGLYGETRYPTEIWYPGGKLTDALPQIEYRLRK